MTRKWLKSCEYFSNEFPTSKLKQTQAESVGIINITNKSNHKVAISYSTEEFCGYGSLTTNSMYGKLT